MRQAVTVAIRQTEVSDLPDPGLPGPGEVLVDVAAVGICGSDIGMWAGTDPYSTYPIRQGHEFSVRVLEVGSGVPEGIRAGGLYAVEPLLSDGDCVACRRGRPNCCTTLRVYGAHIDGALVERMILPARNLYAADGLTAELAAFVEPVSIGIQVVARSGATERDQTVIFGAGPIGQATLLAAVDRGVPSLVVDLVPERLELAKAHGAEWVVDGRSGDLADHVARWTGADGPTVVIDATGSSAVLPTAIELVAPSGTVVVAGTPAGTLPIEPLALVKKELDLRGSRNSVGAFGAAVDLVQRQRAACESLITQRFALGDVQRAFELGAADPAATNKMMVVFDD